MSFQDYLQNRQSAFNMMTDSLKKELNPESRKREDDRLWKPQMGPDGTGFAVIRFLPGTDPNKTPWIKIYDHAFQGPTGKWYIENSLTTIGQKDPVSEYNTKLWNSGLESNKDIARKQKRRTNYMANVFVIKDPANAAADGKVKVFKFGQKIFDKIMAALQPEFEGDDPLNPFDLFEGANFRIKLKMVGGYWNYDASDFERVSPLSQDDSKLESIFNAQHDIHSFIAPDKFKSYQELSAKLSEVLGEGAAVTATESQVASEQVEQKRIGPAATAPAKPLVSAETSSDSGDEELEQYFKSLAAE